MSNPLRPRSSQLVLTFTVTLLLTTVAANAQAPDVVYSDLSGKAAAGDTSIDFRALRLACAKASKCNARGDSADLIAMRRASQSQNYKEVAKFAEKLISAGFPNIEAHTASAEAYGALEQPEKAKLHREIASALIRSIMQTGDGRTKKTALEVIGTQEEHLILAVMGLRISRQSLISGKPHSYDMIEAADPKSGQQVTIYFNIDAFFPMKGL